MIAKALPGRIVVVVVFVLVALLSGVAAKGHESSTVELSLDAGAQSLQVEMDLLDLDFQLGIRQGQSAQITAGDVRTKQPEIRDYVLQNIQLSTCPLVAANREVGVRTGRTTRVVVDIDVQCEEFPSTMEVESTIFDSFPGYRTVIQVRADSNDDLYVLSDGFVQIVIAQSNVFASFVTFVVEGVWHIWIGIDHLAFLLLLVLPLSLSGTLRERCISVMRIVTAFTIAHSITLVLSTLGHLSLPSGPVEVLIAASVVFVAGLNVLNKTGQVAWPLAYIFGLIHGFGFAGAFNELAISAGLQWHNLLAFNLGVEVGQVAFVVAALVVFRWLSRTRIIGRMFVPVSSFALGCVGVVWIAERI